MGVPTALEIVQAVCDEQSLGFPNDLTGSTDKTMRQMLALLNREGRALSQRWDWQVMTWEATFVTNGVEDQGSILTMTDAIDQTWRYVLDDTLWNRTTRMPILGPLSPFDWQFGKSIGVIGPYPQYRIDKNRILLLPAPAAGQTCAFEFVSRSWVTIGESGPGTGFYKERVDKNDDLIVLDTDLVTAGVTWRWRKAKELDYAEDFAEYERMVDDAIARDKSAKKLRVDGGGENRRPSVSAAPGSWNVTLE